jgi:hypothetical protein
MRSWLPLALAGALLAACGASAFAIPSAAGPTGIVMLPTARIAPVDQWQTAIGYRSFHVETGSISMYETQDIDMSLWSLNFLKGVSSDVELWVTYTRATDGEDSNVWEFGGKYRFHGKFMPKGGFWNGLDASVGLSIGRWVDALWVDTAGMYGDTVYFSDTEILRSYFVLTKQLVPTYEGEWEWSPPPHTRVDGTLGLLYLELNPDFGDSSTLLQWFFGVEVLFRNGIAFATEYRSKDSDLEDDPLFSVLLRYPVDRQIDLEFGLANASPVGLGRGDHDLFVRATYSIPVADY